jgi:hypothetical protein
MEDFEKKSVELATHKLTCWIIYGDGTFVIWSDGQEKLAEFLNHLSGLHNNVQFTMKRKKKATFHPWTLISTEKRTAP